MEASDTSGQPPAEAGETGATGQPDQSQPDQSQPESPAPAQEEPAADSNLTTEQPDQPVQPESERQDSSPEEVPTDNIGEFASREQELAQDQSADEAPSKPRYEPPAQEEPPAPVVTNDQQTQSAVDRGVEQDAARQQHNERTGGGPVQEGELQQARQEHNDRTGGGQVPGVEPQASQPADGSG